MTTLRSLKPPASNLPGDLIQEILSLVSCMWLVPYGQKRVVIRKDLMASLHQSPNRVSAQKHFTGNPSRKTNCLKDKNQDTSSSNTTIFCFCWLQRGRLDFVQFLCLATITKRGKKPGMRHTPVVLAFVEWREESQKFKVMLGCIVSVRAWTM